MPMLRLIEVPGDVAMIGTGGVHEQQSVSGGGSVHDDELVVCLVHSAAELLEDGDLLGAGAHEVLGEGGAAGVVDAGRLRRPAGRRRP